MFYKNKQTKELFILMNFLFIYIRNLPNVSEHFPVIPFDYRKNYDDGLKFQNNIPKRFSNIVMIVIKTHRMHLYKIAEKFIFTSW